MAIHTAPNFQQAQTEFEDILKSWRRNVEFHREAPNPLCYILQHKLKGLDLRASNMKGKDHDVVSFARKISASAGVDVFLAELEHEIEGEVDDPDPDIEFHCIGNKPEEDREFWLRRVVDLDGNEVAKLIMLEEENLVQEYAIDDQVPDREDYEPPDDDDFDDDDFYGNCECSTCTRDRIMDCGENGRARQWFINTVSRFDFDLLSSICRLAN